MTQIDTLPHGMHPQISDAVYRKHPAINYSHLKHGLTSPKKLKASLDGLLPVPGASVDLGSVVHALVLQPDRFDDLIAVKKKVDGRTTEGKAYNAAFDRDNAGKVIVDTETLATAKRMQEEIRKCDAAAALLERPGASELVLRWAIGDIECKAKIDHAIDGDDSEADGGSSCQSGVRHSSSPAGGGRGEGSPRERPVDASVSRCVQQARRQHRAGQQAGQGSGLTTSRPVGLTAHGSFRF